MHSTVFNNTRDSKVPSLRGTFGKEGGGEAKLLISPFPSGVLWHRCLFISVLLIDGLQSILLLSTVHFSGFSLFVALNFGVRVLLQCPFEECKHDTSSVIFSRSVETWCMMNLNTAMKVSCFCLKERVTQLVVVIIKRG